MYRSYKFRIYPTKIQKKLINKNLGCKRFVYNYFLNKIIKSNTKTISTSKCIKELNTKLIVEYPFLKEVDILSLYKSIFNLYDNLNKHNDINFKFPKYKSKYERNSYNIVVTHKKIKSYESSSIQIDVKNKIIKLPKLDSVKIRGYRNLNKINVKIKNVTISKEANGKYYISILSELENVPIINTPKTIVGIDVGIKNLLTLSDGTIIANNKYIEKYEKRIQKLQKELAKKQKGSNNYYKCKQKLTRLYTKLKNARKYSIHKITKKITDEYDIIVCESLNIKNMIEQKNIAKKLTDATLAEIIKQLDYKSKWKGKYFYQIAPYYASSQICSRCGNQNKKYKDIKLRNYECSICKNRMDRDLNASINIMYEGLKIYMKNLV